MNKGIKDNVRGVKNEMIAMTKKGVAEATTLEGGFQRTSSLFGNAIIDFCEAISQQSINDIVKLM